MDQVKTPLNTLGGMSKVRVEVLTNWIGVVVQPSPSRRAEVFAVNPEPFRVMMVSLEPAVMKDGLSEVNTGAGANTTNVTATVAGVPEEGVTVSVPL